MTAPKYSPVERAVLKYQHAMKVFDMFDMGQVYVEYKPKKNSVELTAFFRYQGVKYRHDYEIMFDEPLPKIQKIRENVWWSMREWQKSKAPTACVPAARMLATQYGNLVYTGP